MMWNAIYNVEELYDKQSVVEVNMEKVSKI